MNKERSRAAWLPEAVQELNCWLPSTGEVIWVNTPHGSDMFAGLWVGDGPVSRELVGFLAVFSASLPVSLTGEGAKS
jgi:hypothetical protein